MKKQNVIANVYIYDSYLGASQIRSRVYDKSDTLEKVMNWAQGLSGHEIPGLSLTIDEGEGLNNE